MTNSTAVLYVKKQAVADDRYETLELVRNTKWNTLREVTKAKQIISREESKKCR